MPRKSKWRVIVDTNCWISFLIGKRLRWLTELLSEDFIQLIVCDELLEEIREVATRPKFSRYFPQEEVESFIEFLKLISEHSEPKGTIKLCRDEADDYLLALAIEAKAHFLVTGDQDLLVLRHVSTCQIVDANAFEKIVLPKWNN